MLVLPGHGGPAVRGCAYSPLTKQIVSLSLNEEVVCNMALTRLQMTIVTKAKLLMLTSFLSIPVHLL